MTTSTQSCRAACRALWAVAIAMLIFICIWPLLAGMVAANDDVGYVRDDRYTGTLVENIRSSWLKASVFRPLEVAAAKLCDISTLECRPVMIIQIAGLFAVIAGLAVIVRRLMPQHRVALPLLIIWLVLSPATTVSLWQMDSCSQTWSAACGIWAGLLTWMAVDAARSDRAILPWVVGLSVFAAISVNIKEMMYGWFFGIGVAVLAVIARAAWQRDWRSANRCAWFALPVIALPMLHLACRLKFSALGRTLESSGEPNDQARYQAALGANVLNNAWLSLVGLFGNGPLHLVDDAEAMLPLRMLTLVSLVSVFVVLTSAGVIALVHGSNTPSDRSRRRALILCAIAGLLSVSVTLPMGQVSELYGMGANAGSGLLVVAALLALWNPAKPEDRVLCRSIAAFCAAVGVVAGVYGLGSRAYHFRITWWYAREMNRTLLDHQRAVEPSSEPFMALVGQPCFTGRLHSQYIVSPLQAVGFEGTRAWMNLQEPTRRIVFVEEAPMIKAGPRDLVLRCDDLPARGHW